MYVLVYPQGSSSAQQRQERISSVRCIAQDGISLQRTGLHMFSDQCLLTLHGLQLLLRLTNLMPNLTVNGRIPKVSAKYVLLEILEFGRCNQNGEDMGRTIN